MRVLAARLPETNSSNGAAEWAFSQIEVAQPQPDDLNRYVSEVVALTITKSILCVAVLLTSTMGCQQSIETKGTTVNQDENAIRKWFDDWMTATKEGDLELARSLIADDAIFLVPGAGQMDKQSFAEAATASDPDTDFQLDCDLQEIRILGDHAWLVATISLAMTDKETQTRTLMKGDGISILERRGDGWVVIRDANTMIAVPTE
tara:strand:- start:71868 stop:72482 length:615 start_codon:yes stop_codon:yes gene_type:complete